MLFLKSQGDREYIESIVACFAAPVSRGLKCGALLNLSRRGRDMRRPWSCVRKELAGKLSLEFSEISSSDRSLLILIYRSGPLMEAVASDGALELLAELGYEGLGTAEAYIDELARRFKTGIPHEIGLFLGYPPEDVRGFIENGGKNSKLSGYWKVYGDVNGARKKFDEYKKAETESALLVLKNAGRSVRAA
jgi:hypothetical protein